MSVHEAADIPIQDLDSSPRLDDGFIYKYFNNCRIVIVYINKYEGTLAARRSTKTFTLTLPGTRTIEFASSPEIFGSENGVQNAVDSRPVHTGAELYLICSPTAGACTDSVDF